MTDSDTQSKRRVRYGLNVAVAVIAAVGIVVLVNWIGYRQFVRLDFTATRQYSLSPQTLNVLKNLEGEYRLVTLFSRSGPYIDQARDLVSEYERYGRALTTRHIDPAQELGRLEAFYGELRQRYALQTTPLEGIISEARDTLRGMQEQAQATLDPLRAVLEDPAMVDQDLKRFVQSVARVLSRLETEINTVDRQISKAMDRPLPRFSRAISATQTLLANLDQQLYTPAIDRLSQAADTDDTPASIADRLLMIVDLLKQAHQDITDTTATLQEAPAVRAYDKLISQLDLPDVLVVVSPDQVRVIGVDEMFRQPDPDQLQPGQQPELRFQGEEIITGVLVSMSLDQQPMVVFVTTGQLQAVGPRGMFQQVAQRLRNMKYRIEEWNPTGGPGPMGQPRPPSPPPAPEPGQKVVWIILPTEPPNPMNPFGAGAAQKVADLLQTRLDAGDGAMVMLAVSPMARFGSGNPIAQMLTPWGITPQIDRLILRQVTLPDHQTQVTRWLNINRWPSGLPVSQALAGLPGVFGYASPLVLGKGRGKDHKVWPLAQVSGDDVWTHRGDLQSESTPKLDPAMAGGPFVIAAAAQRDSTRLIVVGDPIWASDQVTTMGPQGLPAEIFGVAFPGNAELFVNSVYWLAGLDQLIAASPRTQDIRRIGPMTDTSLGILKGVLLAGMPLAIFAAGIGVWIVRRRG